MFFVTRTFCHCSPWHTNISLAFYLPLLLHDLVTLQSSFWCLFSVQADLYASHDLHPVDRHVKTNGWEEPLCSWWDLPKAAGGEGGGGLSRPWPTPFVEEEKQLQPGQRRKGGEPLTQGEQHGTPHFSHSIKQVPWQEKCSQGSHLQRGIMPSGCFPQAPLRILLLAPRPEPELFTFVCLVDWIFVSELSSARVKTH